MIQTEPEPSVTFGHAAEDTGLRCRRASPQSTAQFKGESPVPKFIAAYGPMAPDLVRLSMGDHMLDFVCNSCKCDDHKNCDGIDIKTYCDCQHRKRRGRKTKALARPAA